MVENTERDRLLTVLQTAKLLGVCTRTLHNLIEIPRVRIGRSVRFDPRDIERFIADRKVVSDG